jgi:hypothetical protein
LPKKDESSLAGPPEPPKPAAVQTVDGVVRDPPAMLMRAMRPCPDRPPADAAGGRLAIT